MVDVVPLPLFENRVCGDVADGVVYIVIGLRLSETVSELSFVVLTRCFVVGVTRTASGDSSWVVFVNDCESSLT